MTNSQTVKAEIVNDSSQMVASSSTATGRYVEEFDMPFRTWVNQEVAKDTPDFQMSGILSPALGKRFASPELERLPIGDFLKIPKVSSLTAAEENFAEWMDTRIGNNRQKVTSFVTRLAKKLRAFDAGCIHKSFVHTVIKTAKVPKDSKDKPAYKKGEKLTVTYVSLPEQPDIISEIWRKKNNTMTLLNEIVVGEDVEEEGTEVELVPPLSIGKSKDLIYAMLSQRGGDCYDIFMDDEGEAVDEIMRIANTTTSEKNQDILKITFMLAHRVDPDWSIRDSYQLLSTERDLIMKLWRTEANGGVEPVEAKDSDEDDEPEPVSEAEEKLNEDMELMDIPSEKKQPETASPG
jgi:hypothetical protein